MDNKLIITEYKIGGDWVNFPINGKEYSCKLTSNPKIKAIFDQKLPTPFEIECKVIEKGDKTFVWDFEERKPTGGGGRPAQPKNEKLITVQFCLGQAVQFLKDKKQLNQDGTQTYHTSDDVLKLTDKFLKFCLEKGGAS